MAKSMCIMAILALLIAQCTRGTIIIQMRYLLHHLPLLIGNNCLSTSVKAQPCSTGSHSVCCVCSLCVRQLWQRGCWVSQRLPSLLRSDINSSSCSDYSSRMINGVDSLKKSWLLLLPLTSSRLHEWVVPADSRLSHLCRANKCLWEIPRWWVLA